MKDAPHRHLPLALSAALAVGVGARWADAAEPRLAHVVFFTLKERTPEARQLRDSKPYANMEN